METQTPEKRRRLSADELEDEEEEEQQIQELEREVREMGRRILDARRTIPDRLLQTLSSRLLAGRPILPPQTLTDIVRGEMPAPSHESHEKSLPTGADQRMNEKLLVLRAKAESNISAIPLILKRINDCILRIEELENCDVNVHSVFNRPGLS
ncbi:hypothetical protein Cni_G15908 [Canna indica]|uniref:Uncharacterized protein n=1 Tax=Canna indica TaxID=4628 RepID=A0AAQ3QG99_9LILI|nr:hypothetical protein Cni_G15908 [Canna indica]